MLFPYSVDRDRTAWRWSWGAYAEARSAGPSDRRGDAEDDGQGGGNCRRSCIRLPLDLDFFKQIEEDLVQTARERTASRAWVCDMLRALPLLIDARANCSARLPNRALVHRPARSRSTS